jgi:hypothetical protein
MSRKEEMRFAILQEVKSKRISQIKAAEILEISDRQVRNLLNSMKNFGIEGVVSKKRGWRGHNKINDEKKSEIIKLIVQNYNDFSPTLAAEKLEELHQIKVSRETLRKWMIQIHLWVPHVRKKKLHRLRQRKEYFGEMYQGDGSHHDWFENGFPCALLYFIDDATNEIISASFETGETLDGYFKILEQSLLKFGVPISIYTDRFRVFESSIKDNLTQFKRALETLEIKWIGANSPQAKGRIERSNRTLQDRLVKELRLRGIKTIEEGNKFLPEFLEKYNKKFSKKPMKTTDLHRPLDGQLDLSRTLSRYEERTLTKDLTFQFHNTHYKILEPVTNCFLGKKIEVRENKDGVRAFDGARKLNIKNIYEIEEEKEEKPVWSDKNIGHPISSHPWKKQSYNKMITDKKKKNSACYNWR